MSDAVVETVEETGMHLRHLRLWLVLGMAIVVVAAAYLVHDRGLEITDEAYYLLSASQPENITAYVSAQHWILAPFWAVSGDLASFRLIGLAALLGSSAVFSLGLTEALAGHCRQSKGQTFGLIFALSLAGALTYLTTINLSPSYNLMASVASYAAIGLALLSATRQGRTSAIGSALGAGLVLAVELASKPSSGIGTFLLLGLFYGAASPRLPRALGLWAVTGIGLAAGLGVLVALQGPLGQTKAALGDGLALFRIVQSEPIALRLLRYAQDYLIYLAKAVVFFLPSLAAFSYAAYRPSRRSIGLWLVLMLASLAIGQHYLGGSNHGATQDFVRQISPLLVMLLMATGLCLGSEAASGRIWMLVAGLFLAPYGVAIGTGNALYTQVIDTLAPWGGMIAVLASLHGLGRRGMISDLLTVVFAFTLSSQIVSSLTLPPYHQRVPLVAQTLETNAGTYGRVNVDAETAAFVQDIETAARTCGIPQGAAYLGLYNNPGVALILRAKTVTSPWINNLDQAEVLLPAGLVAGLQNVIVARSARAGGGWSSMPASLAMLETAFRLCGIATYPYGAQKMQIWFRAGRG